MKVKILFDKDALNERFDTGWGVSFLVGEDILFDVGEKFEYIEKNAGLMNIDLKKITKVVISHDHWDHINGLWGLIKINPGIVVYVCSRLDETFKTRIKGSGVKLVEVKESCSLTDQVYSAGEALSNDKGKALFEQSLVINAGGRITLICGCCHPGILNLIQKMETKLQKNIDCVLGGLHLMDKDKRFIKYVVDQLPAKVKKIGPSHCTGYDAVTLIREIFQDNFIEIKAGRELDV